MRLRKFPYYFASIFELAAEVRPLSTVWQVFSGAAQPGVKTITLPRQRIQFKVRGVMDIWSVKETFLDRFYERFGAAIGTGWTIVDIGGGIGDFTTFAARVHPSNKVYAFEPTPESFALLQENLVMNAVQNAQAFPEAIWSQSGNLKMDVTAGEPGQYVSYEDSPSLPGQVQVQSISLQDAFERLGITQCDLLKMDCEGAEFAILFNTPDRVLDRISRVVMEYHDSITQFTHADLEDYFSKRGYQVKVSPNYVHSDLGYLYAERV